MVYKTDYPEHYKYWIKGHLGQILASNDLQELRLAILDDWSQRYLEDIQTNP